MAMCVSLLGFSLFCLAWSHSLSTTLRNQNTIKSWINDSGVYDQLGANMIEQIVNEPAGELNKMTQYSEVQQAATEILQNNGPLQQSVEQSIDSLYIWLEGEEPPQPFQISLAGATQQLAENLSSLSANRASKLPICSHQQLAALGVDYNAWTASCRPSHLSTKQISDTVKKDILHSMNSATVDIQTTDIISLNASQTPEQLRQAYQLSRWLPLIFIAIASLAASCLILISPSRLKGFIKVAWACIFSGIITGLSALFTSRGPSFVGSVFADTNQLTVDAFIRLAEVAGQGIAQTLWRYATLMIIIGLAVTVIARTLQQQQYQPSDKTE